MEQASVYREPKLIRAVNYFVELQEGKGRLSACLPKSQMQAGPFQKSLLPPGAAGIKQSEELLPSSRNYCPETFSQLGQFSGKPQCCRSHMPGCCRTDTEEQTGGGTQPSVSPLSSPLSSPPLNDRKSEKRQISRVCTLLKLFQRLSRALAHKQHSQVVRGLFPFSSASPLCSGLLFSGSLYKQDLSPTMFCHIIFLPLYAG